MQVNPSLLENQMFSQGGPILYYVGSTHSLELTFCAQAAGEKHKHYAGPARSHPLHQFSLPASICKVITHFIRNVATLL